MITALAPAPTLPVHAPAETRDEAWAEADFAAEFQPDEEPCGEDEAMVLVLAGLTAAQISAPAADGGDNPKETDAAPPVAAGAPVHLPEQTASAETTPTEGITDWADTPPSAETAVRMQMADEAAGEPPRSKDTLQEPAPVTDSPKAAAAIPAQASTADSAAPATPPLIVTAPEAPAPRGAQAQPPLLPDRPPARQAAEAISSALSNPGSGESVELVLRPEELGRVRLELRSEGDRLVVTMTADRPETMDLLRRHLPELRAELEQAGYGAADLNFGQSGTPGGQRDAHSPTEIPGFMPIPTPAPPSAPRATGTGGLDLRL